MAGLLENSLYQSDIIRVSSADIPWEKMDGKRVLISGAAGMIASVIIDILMERNRSYGQNIQVYAVSRSRQKAKKRFDTYWDSPAFTWISHDINKVICHDTDSSKQTC